MCPRRFMLRVPDELLKSYEKDAKEKGISLNQRIKQELENSLKRKPRPQDVPSLREITTKYEGTCKKCNNPIPVGSTAYWSKDIIICNDCYLDRKIEELGDKVLGKKYLKTRELNKIIKVLKTEADYYADFIIEQKHEIKYMEISKKIDSLVKLNDDYLRRVATPQEKELLQKVNELYKQVQREWEDLKALLTAKIEPLRKRKGKRKLQYAD